MRARCGLEDCDCEYTIEKLLAALKGFGGIAHRLTGCSQPGCRVCEENADVVRAATIAIDEAER